MPTLGLTIPPKKGLSITPLNFLHLDIPKAGNSLNLASTFSGSEISNIWHFLTSRISTCPPAI